MPDNDKILSDFFRTLGGQKKDEKEDEPPTRLSVPMSPLDPSQQGKGEPLIPYDRRLLPDWAPSNLISPHPGGDGPHQREATLSDKEMKAAVEESARLRRLAEDEALAEKQFELRGKLTVSVPRSAELDKELDEINREEYLYGGARKGLSAMRGDATDRDLNKWDTEIEQKVGRFLKKANVRELKHYGKSLDEIVEMEREDARKAVEANKAFELRARGVDSPDIGPRERGIHEQIFDSGIRRAFSPLIGPTERQVAEWEAEGVSERGMMQRVGLVPKAFTPSDWYTEWSEPIKEDVRGWAEDNPDSSLKAAAAGITNTAFDLFGVVGTSPGGVLLLASGAAAPAIAGESGVALYHANVARAFSVDLTRAALEHAPSVVDTYKSSDATKVEKAEAIAGEAALILFAWLSRQSSKKQFEKAHNIKLEDIQTRKDALEAVDTIKENILKEETVKEFEKEMGVKSEEKTDSQKLVDEWSKEAERSAKEKFSERETQRAIERSLMEEREPVGGSKPLEGKEMTPEEAGKMAEALEKAAKEFEEGRPTEPSQRETGATERIRLPDEKFAREGRWVTEEERAIIDARDLAEAHAATQRISPNEFSPKPVEAPKPVEGNLKGLDRADDGKVYVDRRIDFDESPERFTQQELVDGIEQKTVTEPINEALFDPSLMKLEGLDKQRLEIRNQQKELQAKGVFEGRPGDFTEGALDKWIELMNDKGDALERWEADHKELYDQYNELEKQYKLIHRKFRYTSSIDEVLTRVSLEHSGLVKEEPLTFDTTYHVTRTINVPSVLKEGIISGGGKSFKPVDPSHPNYEAIMERGEVGGVGGSLGRVHSFESLNDAMAWAAKMDWELATRAKRASGGAHGSGEISIIPIRGGKNIKWQLDPELAKSGDKGLRRFGNVPPEYLGEPVKVDKKLFDDWIKAARESKQLELAPEAPKPVEGVETSLAAQAAKDAAAAKVIEDAAKIEKAITEPVVPEPLAEPPKHEVLGTKVYDKMLKDEAIRELEDGSFVWEGQGRFVKVLEDRFGEQPFWRLTKLDPRERAYTPELPELPVTPKTAEEVGPMPEDTLASKAKEVEEVVESLERERTIKEAITEESWSDTHERTDVTGSLSVKRYNEMVDNGTIKELPDGSSHWPDGPSMYERFIKEKDGGLYRTTKLSEKGLTPEVPAEPPAEPPKPPTEGAPPEGAMPEGEGADAATRMKGVVKRQIAKLRKEGRGDLANRLEADPLSYYEVVSSKAHIEMVRGLDILDVEALIAMEGEVPNLKGSILGLLEGRKLDILGERAESATPENAVAARDAYESYLNYLSTKAKSFGQFNAQMREIGVSPRAQADVVDAMLEENNAPKLSAEDRASYTESAEKQREIKEELEKAEEDYWENPTEENFLKAKEIHDSLLETEIGKVDILSRNTPRLWTDMFVQMLQGNLLTPATVLTTNPFGNIVPILPRAAVRGNAAILVEIMDEFMRRRPARVELERLEQRLDEMSGEGPEAKKIAQRIAKLLDITDPLERNRLTGLKGARDKWWRGFVWKGLGIRRIQEALKKPKGERWDWLKHEGYDDATKALLFGQRNMQYEVESETLPVPTLNAIEAGSRFYEGIMEKPKDLAAANQLAKDFAEAVFGLHADGMFRALAALDLPFRHGEYNRILREYGMNRYKWEEDPATGRQKRVPDPLTEKQIEQSQIYPELFWDQKTIDKMWNEASKATFQNENIGTEAMSSINQFIRGVGEKYLKVPLVGDAAYLGHRMVTPYQKTLINITGENMSYVWPIGIIDYVIKAREYGANSREAKLSLSRAMVGLTVYGLAQYLIPKGLITPNMEQVTEDDPRYKYLMEKAFPSAYLNMTGVKRLLDGEDHQWREGDEVWNLEKMGPPGQLLLTQATVAFELEKLPKEEKKKIEDSFVRLQARHLKAQVMEGTSYSVNQSFAQGAKDFLWGLYRVKEDADKDRQYTVLKPFSKAIPSILLPNTLDWFYKQELNAPWARGKPNPYKQNFRADKFTEAMRYTWDRRLSVLGIGDGVDKIPPLVDMWGSDLPHIPERIKTEGKWTKVLMYNMFNVAAGKHGKSGGKYDPTGRWIPDPGASEVYRVWRETRDARAVPAIPSRFITIPGAKKGEPSKMYKLNKEQYYKYSKLVGTYRYMGAKGKHYQVSTNVWKRKFHDGVYQMVTHKNYIGKDGKPTLDKFQTVDRLANIYSVNSKLAKKDFLRGVKVEDMEEVKKPSGMSSGRWENKVIKLSD